METRDERLETREGGAERETIQQHADTIGMGGVRFIGRMASHKNLRAWQLARNSAREIHALIDRRWVPSRGAAFEQLRRASLSVQLNIAEGYSMGIGPRCKYHLRIAFGSAVETTELLEFVDDGGPELERLIAQSVEVQQVTYGLWRRSKERLETRD